MQCLVFCTVQVLFYLNKNAPSCQNKGFNFWRPTQCWLDICLGPANSGCFPSTRSYICFIIRCWRSGFLAIPWKQQPARWCSHARWMKILQEEVPGSAVVSTYDVSVWERLIVTLSVHMLPMQKRACWSSQKRHYVAPNAGTSLIPWGFDVCWTYWFIAIYVDMHGFRMHCSHAMLVYVETWLWPNKKRHLFLEIDVFLFLTQKKEGFCGSRYIYISYISYPTISLYYPSLSQLFHG